MRLSFSLSGDEIVSTIEEGTLSFKRALVYQPDAIDAAAREVVGVLERGNRAHTLSDSNIANLHDVGGRLCGLLVPREIQSRLSRADRSMYLQVDESLVPVPWELLHDGETFWCRHFDMGRAVATPQAAVGQAAPLPSVGPLSMLVVCSNPRGDLPQVESEGERLIERLDATTTIDVRLLIDPTVEAVRRALKEHDIVHFAGHADHDPDNPANSGWHLSDGKLTAEDVVKLSAGGRHMPLAVFSNACRSSQTSAWLGSSDQPQEVYGLANAFLLGGVRLYLGTQWEVVDGQSSEFAVAFYEALSRGASAGTAVRVGRNEVVREAGESALAWASYVLYGDPGLAPVQPVESERTQPPMPSASLLEARVSAPWKRPAARYSGKRPSTGDLQAAAAAAGGYGRPVTEDMAAATGKASGGALASASATAAPAATAPAVEASATSAPVTAPAAAAAPAASNPAPPTAGSQPVLPAAAGGGRNTLVIVLSIAVALLAVGVAVGVYMGTRGHDAAHHGSSKRGGAGVVGGGGGALAGGDPLRNVSSTAKRGSAVGHLDTPPSTDPLPMVAILAADSQVALRTCVRRAIEKRARFRVVADVRVKQAAAKANIDLGSGLSRAQAIKIGRGLRADLVLHVDKAKAKLAVLDALTGDAPLSMALGAAKSSYCERVSGEMIRIIHGEGRVVSISGAQLVVDIGWKSRVAPGAALELLRGGKVVGTLTVAKVEMHKSVCSGKAKVGDVVRVPRK